MKRKSELQKGVLSLVVLSFLFASMGIFARYLATGFETLQQVYLRIFAATALSLLVFIHQIDFKRLQYISKKEWGVLVLRGITLYGIGVPLVSQALLDTKYGNVAFISSLPFVALYGFLFFKEKVTVTKILLILLAVFGVGLIAIQDFHSLFSWGRGEVLALLAGASVGVSYVARRWQSDELNNQEMTFVILGFGALSSLTLSIIVGQGVPTSWSWGLGMAVVVAGAINILNMLLTNYGFARVSNVLASNIIMLQVLFAVIIGYVGYGERLGIRELLGGLIIVVSVLLMNQHTASVEVESGGSKQ